MAEALPRHILAYDAHCGTCSRFKAVVEFLDARGRIAFMSLEQAESARLLDDVPRSLRYRSFHLISSPRSPEAGIAVKSGSEGILPLAELLFPENASFSRSLEKVPGLRRSISFGYTALSRLHGGGSCKTEAHHGARTLLR